MYGQGSYNNYSQSGQVPQMPANSNHPPSYQQLPPPLPHSAQPGMGIYQQGPMASRQFPPGGVMNASQPCLSPIPNVRGSATVPRMYTGVQQNSYLAPALLAPPSSKGLLPTPAPGKMLYGAPDQMLQQQQPGGVQGLQSVPLFMVPGPNSSFLTSSSSETRIHTLARSSQMPSMALLPPPRPPSCPPTVLPYPQPQPMPYHRDGMSSSSRGSVTLDLPSPPPKPDDENIVRKIEQLCKLIAENGSSYEDMARQKESGNPEFEFLFGGGPGSKAAIAHGYFLWMKKKCVSECKLDEGETYARLRPLGVESSLQVEAGSHSSADSDMEMEDDITQSDDDQAANHPVGGPKTSCQFISNGFDVQARLHVPQTLSESHAALVTSSEKVLFSGSSKLGEQESKLSSRDQLTSEGLVAKVHSLVSYSAESAKSPSASNCENYATTMENKSLPRALSAAECSSPNKFSGQAIEGSSAFRLIQAYASDDNSENDAETKLKDTGPKTISLSVSVGAESSHEVNGFNLETNAGSKSPYTIEKGLGLRQLPQSSVLCRAYEPFSDSQTVDKQVLPTSVAIGPIPEHIDTKHEDHASISYATSPMPVVKEEVSYDGLANVAFSGKIQKGNEDKSTNITLNAQKVDKFGRLAREGASDSDSDDKNHARWRSGKGTSCSRSRSPLDRRRRRRKSRSRSPRRRRDRSRSRSRSPRRRRNKRSRSRSRSPRNRSRSRSPTHRRAGEFSGGNVRRERAQMADCFDFLRGRCYRGAFCRYRHHDSEKSDGSRQHKTKQQYQQLQTSSKHSAMHKEIKKMPLRLSDYDHAQEMQLSKIMPSSSFDVTKDGIVHKGEESVSDALQNVIANEDGQLVYSEKNKPNSCEEVAAKVPKANADKNFQEAMESDQPLVVDKPVGDASILRLNSAASQNVVFPIKDALIQQSQSDLSDPVLEDAEHPPQQTDDSSISDSSPNKTSITPQNKLHASDSLPNMTQALPLPLSAPLPEANAPTMMQSSRDYNLMPQVATFQSQSASLESFPYMLPKQNSVFSAPPNKTWVSLPSQVPSLAPYDPTISSGIAPAGVSSQFQPSHLPLRDFGSQTLLRPYSTEFPVHSRVGEFQNQFYAPTLESHHSTKVPLQSSSGLGSFAPGHNYNQPAPFFNESPATKMQPFSGNSQPPGEILKSSQIYPNLQQQQQSYGSRHTPDSVYNLTGSIKSSGYPADLLDANHPSGLPDFGVARSLAHYNPYASTFEQPLSSKFSSDLIRQQKDELYSSKYNTLDGQGVGSVESRLATSSSNSAKDVGKDIPGSGGCKYDPLADSIEPSSNSIKKFNHIEKWEPLNDSDMFRLKGHNNPLDVEENNKKKEFGGITVATSVDNEEYGETADAEVGAVESDSHNSPNAIADMNISEMEIDQIKSPGKSRKGKESRSMKLFKVALADFVKEVLKPSWRQGNMSKEAFKTVVKKTVDKVSGATKSHQIPKSRAKIEQYIDSSQRKLTKLVMGYVDKYAKG